MTFVNMNFALPIIIFLGLFFFFYIKSRTNFFRWVEDHWFYRQSLLNKFSTYLYIVGMVLIVLALLDLRGAEKRIKGTSQETKTVILIDSSASMLAEDVRPNRFSKALLLVKHYVKKAIGQQISLVVFSDHQKRIIPFTDDIDLIYARLERLESLNLGRGGTGLSQAIAESVEYFKSSGGELSGNILIFTDAEETELSFPLTIPDGITVGMIGIGTAKGAAIPVRDSRGEFRGNKKFQGKVVISKLDENVLKELSNKIKNYRYWIATSYSLPTEEILAFFSKVDKVKNLENEFRVKPVMANYLLVPGTILLFLAFLLNYRKTFSLGILLVLLQVNNIRAQAPSESNAKEKAPEKSALSLKLEGLLAQNQLGNSGRKKLAESLLKDGFPKLAETLYEEVLPKNFNKENMRDFSNYALSKIKNGKKNEGLNDSKKMLEYIDKNKLTDDKELTKSLEKNILKAIAESGGGGKGNEQNDDDQKGENQEDSKDKSKSEKGDSKNKDKENQKGDEKEKSDDEDKSDEQNEGDQKKNEDEQQKNKESDGKGDKKIPKKKLPAILKQLISDDNKLQKKVIDAKTTERKTREQKDW